MGLLDMTFERKPLSPFKFYCSDCKSVTYKPSREGYPHMVGTALWAELVDDPYQPNDATWLHENQWHHGFSEDRVCYTQPFAPRNSYSPSDEESEIDPELVDHMSDYGRIKKPKQPMERCGLIIFYTDKVGQQGDLAVRAEVSGREVYCEPVSREGYANNQHLHYCIELETGEKININGRTYKWDGTRGGFDYVPGVCAEFEIRNRDQVTDFKDLGVTIF